MLQKINSKFNFRANRDEKSIENNSAINSPSNKLRQINEKQPEALGRVKAGVFLSTVTGMLATLAIAHKKGGFSINPAKLIKTPLKEWGIIKIDYDWKNVILLASGSIGGGLLGGAIFDKKENMKAKLREALIQMLGNILLPLACVAGSNKLFKKHLETKVIDGFKLKGKMAKAPGVVVSALGLGAAIVLGNKVSNFINEDIYHIRDDRTVKIADMSGHLDDTCMAISLAAPGNKISDTVSRFIPLALLVCGYSSGIMQEWPDDVKESRKIDHKLKK